MEVIKQYFNLVWTNVWLKLWFLYLIYLLWVVILWFILRKFVKRLISKTKTDLDDKIVKYTKKFFYFLILLLWINFSLKFVECESPALSILIQVIKSLETLLILVILTKSFSIVKRHLIYKRRSEPEKLNLLNLFYIICLILIYVVGWLYFLKIWGINITPLLASAGIFGLAVAMASQEIIKNFISGVILFFEKPFIVWDLVRLPDWRTARVEEIWLRRTKFRTYLWDVIFIPNSKLLDVLENVRWHITEKRKIELEIWLPYWVDVDKAKRVLMEVLQTEEIFIKDSLEVYVSNLWDWSVNFKVRWDVPVSKYDRKLPSRLYEKIYKKINEVGIWFPFPTYEIILSKNQNEKN